MKKSNRKTKYCKLPSPGNIAGRSSSITNAFFNSLVPVHVPTEQEELKALKLLGMRPDTIQCAYCGDASTEWDHLRPIITDQLPTGFITEIGNLVPACGKCNQSKGKQNWRTWMTGKAPRSPATRKINDLHQRVKRIEAFEKWRDPTRIDFEAIVSAEAWHRHKTNWRLVLDLLKESQRLAKEIREEVEMGYR